MSDVTENFGLILALLTTMTVLIGVAGRLSLPPPVVLVVGGLAIGFVPGLPRLALDPDLVLFVFLPPLLVYAAYSTSLLDVRTYALPIASLSVGLVLVTAVAVAVLAHAVIPGLTWPVAFALGAIVAPPDAVAATSIVGRGDAPRRLGVILEGESLVNDATALTAYRVAVGAAVGGGAFSLLGAGMDFLVAAVGGVIVGLAASLPGRWFYRAVRDPELSITVSFLITYVTYFVAEQVHASGVIAAVVYGVLLGRNDDSLSAQVRVEATVVWRQVNSLLTALVFALIGLQLPGIMDGLADRPAPDLLGYAALVVATVIVVRLLWNAVVPVLLRPLTRSRYPPLSWPERTVVGWAGMRGVVSLAAALALPLTTDDGAPFPQRDLVVFLAFAVILTTLLLQGLTLAPLVRRLGLAGADDDARIQNKARLVATRAALDRLAELEADGWAGDELDGVRRHYEERARLYRDRYRGRAGDDGDGLLSDDIARLKTALLDAEADALARLRDDERISDDVIRAVRNELDLERLRLES